MIVCICLYKIGLGLGVVLWFALGWFCWYGCFVCLFLVGLSGFVIYLVGLGFGFVVVCFVLMVVFG